MAGVDKLKPFGIFGTIDGLAQGNILKHDEVLLYPYRDVFIKLLYEYEKGEYQKRYAEILKQESKR